VRALRAENAELRATNDALAQRLQLLESRLEATLSVASAANGSNGNGRH
jgi:cell division protein FtsB